MDRVPAILRNMRSHDGHNHNHDSEITVVDTNGTTIAALEGEKKKIDTALAKINNPQAQALMGAIKESCFTCIDCGDGNGMTVRNVAPNSAKTIKYVKPDALENQLRAMQRAHFDALPDDLKAEYSAIFDTVFTHLVAMARFHESIKEKCTCCCAEAGGINGNDATPSGLERVPNTAAEEVYTNAITALNACGDCDHKDSCVALLIALRSKATTKRLETDTDW